MAQEYGGGLDDIKTSFIRDYKEWEKRLQKESSSESLIPFHSLRESSKGGKNVVGDGGSSATPRVRSSGSGKPNREETKSELPDHAIYGFENEILSLKNFLLNQKESEEFKTLAVVGKYGVGKTTLCQKIFNDEDVKKAYVPRVWVCMYKEEQREDDDRKTGIAKRIDNVKRILKNLGVEEEMLASIKNGAKEGVEKHLDEETAEEKELAGLLHALHLTLWGKKYLIVLDDAWVTDEWNDRIEEKKSEERKWGTHLSYGFPKGSGGRVIYTSRDEQLAKSLVCEEHNVHLLYPLSDPESVWKIYTDEVEKNKIKVKPRDLEKYKEDLMNKSCGVPLAARILGTITPVDIDELADPAEKKGSSHGKISDNDPRDIKKDGNAEEKTGSSQNKSGQED